MRFFVRLIILISIAGFISACSSRPSKSYSVNVPVAKKQDAPMPEEKYIDVDFSRMLSSNAAYSNNVMPVRSVRPMLSRVLLSPNLVFEASRSSVSEATTTGPVIDNKGTMTRSVTVGSQVTPALSSALLNYMQSKGSELIAPAIIRDLDEYWCGRKDVSCPQVTWVERLLMMSKSKDEKIKSIRPTSAFAVRALRETEMQMSLVVQFDKVNNKLVVKPRTYESEPSICSNIKLKTPAVYFSVELLNAKNGGIVARIDEMKGPKLVGKLLKNVKQTSWAANRKTDYAAITRSSNGSESPDYSSAYQYVSGWNQQNVLCKNISEAYSDIRAETASSMNSGLIAKQLFESSLSRLYR